MLPLQFMNLNLTFLPKCNYKIIPPPLIHHSLNMITIEPIRRVCRLKSPHRKPKKLQKNAENRQEMWAAMTRSLEMIVALFEYYSVSVVPPGTEFDETTPSHDNRYSNHFLKFIASKMPLNFGNLCTHLCIIQGIKITLKMVSLEFSVVQCHCCSYVSNRIYWESSHRDKLAFSRQENDLANATQIITKILDCSQTWEYQNVQELPGTYQWKR